MSGFDSVSTADISADRETVWAVLTDSAMLGDAMFGSEIEADWRVGGPIVYRGEWEGKAFEDHGEVVELSPPSRMRISHSSAGSELHELRFDLEPTAAGTRLTLTQDNNPSAKAAEHSRANWDAMLARLKQLVEV
jgi:uncharacterized protein YndB with AHSA1/START domain